MDLNNETPKSYIPYSYISGFLKFLARNKDRIKVITYDDLCWAPGDTNLDHYKSEFQRWESEKREGRIDNKYIYLILQHDVDSQPARTKEVLLDELRYGIPSNVMIFNKRINRKLLGATGVVEIGDYDIDWPLLKKIQRDAGFVIGYHCNAYERAGFCREKAVEIMHRDIRELSEHVPIKYLSAHGGVRDANGLSNASLDLPEEFATRIRWIHNRYTIRLHAQYSDGGINGKRDPSSRDLRTFAETWEPGKRYRVLLHPQYYDYTYSTSSRLMDAAWYQELIFDSKNPEFDPWADVKLRALNI